MNLKQTIMNRLFTSTVSLLLTLSLSFTCQAQDSDKVYLNYCSEAIGSTDDFKAFVIGSSVTADMLKQDEITSALARTKELAEVVIVGSIDLKELVSMLTGLKVYVADKYFDEVETKIGSSKYWVLIAKADEELSRFVSARDLNRMLLGTKKVENRKTRDSNSERESFFRNEAIIDLIGKTDSTTLLFIGNTVEKDSIINSSVKDLWRKLDAKVDHVIVFSEENKKLVSSVSTANVVFAKGAYEDYFPKVWKSMKRWFWTEFKNGDDGSFISSPHAYDIVSEEDW
ncbi:MAG: hypothetical protein ACPG5W_06500 [Flavobacteriales bacterium]